MQNTLHSCACIFICITSSRQKIIRVQYSYSTKRNNQFLHDRIIVVRSPLFSSQRLSGHLHPLGLVTVVLILVSVAHKIRTLFLCKFRMWRKQLKATPIKTWGQQNEYFAFVHEQSGSSTKMLNFLYFCFLIALILKYLQQTSIPVLLLCSIYGLNYKKTFSSLTSR